MIKFPDIKDYVGDCDASSIVKIRISYNPKNENLRKYRKSVAFRVHSPIPKEFLVELLNKMLNKRKLEIEVSILPEETKFYDEPITLWQLVWFIDNITEQKIISVTINTLNPNYDDNETVTVDLTNEKDVKEFLRKLEEYSS